MSDSIASSLFLYRLRQGGALKTKSKEYEVVSRGEGRSTSVIL